MKPVIDDDVVANVSIGLVRCGVVCIGGFGRRDVGVVARSDTAAASAVERDAADGMAPPTGVHGSFAEPATRRQDVAAVASGGERRNWNPHPLRLRSVGSRARRACTSEDEQWGKKR
jgi:hypothetical protein